MRTRSSTCVDMFSMRLIFKAGTIDEMRTKLVTATSGACPWLYLSGDGKDGEYEDAQFYSHSTCGGHDLITLARSLIKSNSEYTHVFLDEGTAFCDVDRCFGFRFKV